MSKTCLWNFLLNLPTKSKWVSLCNISGHPVNLNSSLNFLTWVGYVIGSFSHFKGPTLKNIDKSNESKAFFNAIYLYNYSCWPNEAQNVNLQKLNLRIEHIAGLNANSFKNYSEPYMCGNYGK